MGVAVTASHNVTVPSSLPLASRLPSGLKATDVTFFELLLTGGETSPRVWALESSTVPSDLPAARIWPFGLTATALTAGARLSEMAVPVALPEDKSLSHSEPSPRPDTNRPSGL